VRRSHDEGNTLVKRTTTFSAVVAGFGLIALGVGATGANADPSGAPTYRAMAVMGSDTVQDVENGFAGVVKSNGSNFYQTGLLHAATIATATSIDTSLAPANGDKLIIDPTEEGNVNAAYTAAATTIAVASNFTTWAIGDKIVVTDGTNWNNDTVSAVSAVSGVYTLTISGLTNSFGTNAVVEGGTATEFVTAGATTTPASAYNAVGPVAARAYNTVTVSALANAHSANALVIGAPVANSTLVMGSYNATGGAAQTKANANCQYISNTGGTGSAYMSGTTQAGVVYSGNGTLGSSSILGARANGSGAGAAAWGDALATASPVWGCLDFSRASAAKAIAGSYTPGSNNSINIPFALDGVDFAVTTTSNYPRKLTMTQLQQIFTCTYPGELPATAGLSGGVYSNSAGTVTFAAAGTVTPVGQTPVPVAAGTYTIQGLSALVGATYGVIPQAGSGTRSFFEGAMGITDANFTGGSYPCLTDKKTDGTSIEEHNQTALDDNGIAPQSIAQAIAQRAQSIVGVTDKQSRSVLGVVDNTAAGNGGTPRLDGTLDYPSEMVTQFGAGTSGNGVLWREVFNIVPKFDLANPNVQNMFVGANSQFCATSNHILLQNYGFAVDPNCGVTTITK